MFTLKCKFCGYEQNAKKIDKYTYYELTHCKHLWYPCNKCKQQHQRPQNFTNDEVMHGWVFGKWDYKFHRNKEKIKPWDDQNQIMYK